MRTMRIPRMTAIAVVVATVATSGCKVTEEDVEYWKGTIKGPGKIVAVMLSDRYPVSLRSEAGIALVEMERPDVNGIVELQNALKRLETEVRSQVLDVMVPKLVVLMQGEREEGAEGAIERETSSLQARAKDAAFLVAGMARPEVQKELVNAIVAWYVEDFNGRSLAGNYSAEQVIRRLGAPAASKLVDALDPKMPQVTLVKLAEIIDQLANAAGQKKAAQRFVEIEKEIATGKNFRKWLEEGIVEQVKQASPDGKVDQTLVNRAIDENIHNFLRDGALPAMRHFSDHDIVAKRLLAIASKSSRDPYDAELRTVALQALEGGAQERHLAALLDLALDDDNPDGVRDVAFDRVGDIGSVEAIPRLWPLVNQTDKPRLRWRAGELILGLGGRDVVPEFLQKLPDDGKAEYASEELEGYATRISQMTPPPELMMRRQLGSSSWWDRVIALRFYKRKGTERDLRFVSRLTRDATALKGPNWPENGTVATIAKETIAAIKERAAEEKQAG